MINFKCLHNVVSLHGLTGCIRQLSLILYILVKSLKRAYVLKPTVSSVECASIGTAAAMQEDVGIVDVFVTAALS